MTPVTLHTPSRLGASFVRIVALFCVVAGLAIAAPAADAPKQSFDVPAAPAEKALRDFSQQAGLQVLFSSDVAKGVQTKAVKGEMTAREALDAMLVDTGLVVVKDPKTEAFSIRRETPEEAKNGSSRPESDRAAGDKVEGGVIKLETFEVMGSKLLNMDVRRSVDDPQPYVIFDREKIEQSGVPNLELFLKQRLTMNTAVRLGSETSSTTSQNSQVNLRGLGTNQTLILIDGRRAPDVSNAGSFSQPEISAIPMGAIERIEILPTTASAIYGGGATGGAINIILRRDYAGAELRLAYDNSFQSDSAISRAELSAGFNMESGKTNLLFSASASNANELVLQDRDFKAGQRALVVANRGYLGYNTASGLITLGVANTTNVRSADGSNLMLKNGTPLNSPLTFIPVGYAGTATDGGTALVANAGKLNLDISRDPTTGSGGEYPFTPQIKMKALSATLRRQFTPNLQGFLEGSYSEKRTSASLSAGLGTVVAFSSSTSLPATAPNNPFQQPILFLGPVPRGPRYNSETTNASSRLALGVIAKLPHDWTAEADYTMGESRYSYKTVGASTYTAALTTAIQSGTVDFLRDTNVYPLDLTAYLDSGNPGNVTLRPFTSILEDASLRTSGSIVRLPAGFLQISGLLEHRREDFDDVTSQGSATSVTFYPARDQSVDSAFAEIRMPLVSKNQKITGIHTLNLQLSIRSDIYTTHAPTGSVNNPSPTTIVLHKTNRVSSTDPLFAISYRPTADLAFRASYGTGFLAPAVNQLVPNIRTAGSSITVTDSKRGNTTTTIVATPTNDTLPSGGNPNLKPERSKSWSAGLVFTPKAISGLRLSIDYVRIDKTDNITTPLTGSNSLLGTTDIAVFEQTFPDRVVRGANLPGDLPGWAGPVIYVDQTSVNLSKAKMDAYDLQLDYDLKSEALGEFGVFVAATRQDHLTQQAVPLAAPVENLGTQNALRYKANAGATWKRGIWTAGWNVTYYDSFWLNSAHTVDLSQGSARIPSQIYHDLFVTFALGHHDSRARVRSRLLNNAEITVGVRDVFNREPPITAVGFPNAPFGDVRLATYWLSFKRSFD